MTKHICDCCGKEMDSAGDLQVLTAMNKSGAYGMTTLPKTELCQAYIKALCAWIDLKGNP